jgi:putative addiction module component (TIGR02574 family)
MAKATKDALMTDVLKLPRKQRAEVARRLLRSLEEPAADKPRSVAAAWDKEICRRADEILAGKATTVDAFAAIRRVREELRKRRAHGRG